ncbi:MAG: SpoIIE family protein phosphatase [Bacteroidia bacterium]|nr:SpoIIE family protein phosphatase [Bacteroidia bacterium]
MRKFFNSIIHIGLSPELPFGQQNKIRIFNTASLFISFVCIFYTLLGLGQQRYLTVIFTFSEFLLLVFGFFLIYKRKYNLGFHFGLITGILFLIGYSLLFGEKSQTHIFLLFMPVAGIILFDCFTTIFVYFVLSAVFLAGSKMLFALFEPYYAYNSIIDTIGWMNFVFTSTLIFLGVRQFKTENINFNREINFQRLELKEKNKDITDSIHYAKRIQSALMASNTLLNKNLPEYFVLYKPKDIVSGDFYWAEQTNTNFLLAACDCTGHGVPGAFMSLLNITKLNEIAREKKLVGPDSILNQLREDIIKVLNPEGTEEGKDGMDAVLCSFDFDNLKLEFACANNPLWIVRKIPSNLPKGDQSLANGILYESAVENNSSSLGGMDWPSLIEFKPDKMPVGMYNGEKKDFRLNSIKLQKGDNVYLFTDGYADQFGGPKGKKFKYAQLKELLLSIHHLPMNEQQALLQQNLEKWKGNLEQVDDILIIGVRV